MSNLCSQDFSFVLYDISFKAREKWDEDDYSELLLLSMSSENSGSKRVRNLVLNKPRLSCGIGDKELVLNEDKLLSVCDQVDISCMNTLLSVIDSTTPTSSRSQDLDFTSTRTFCKDSMLFDVEVWVLFVSLLLDLTFFEINLSLLFFCHLTENILLLEFRLLFSLIEFLSSDTLPQLLCVEETNSLSLSVELLFCVLFHCNHFILICICCKECGCIILVFLILI